MKSCEKCRKRGLFRKTGKWIKINGLERREMICRCGNVQLEEAPQNTVVFPKILYIDIETSTMKLEIETFDLKLRSDRLDWRDIVKSFYIISWAAAWVGDGEARIISDAVTPAEAKRRDDKRCLKKLWELIDQKADYVVGHNSKNFDIKKLETRFFLNHMGTPSKYKQRDTLQIAKKRFRNESNALAYWSKLLGGNPKDHMIKDDWLEVNKGNEKIIRKMLKYNKGDVREGVNILRQFVEYIESNGQTKVFP